MRTNARTLAFLFVLLGSACAPRHGGPGHDDPALGPVIDRLARNPDDVEARLAFAAARREAGDLEGALVEAYKALHSDPRSALAHVERARIYFLRGLLDPEIEAWRAAIEIEPANASHRENLGHALLASGRNAEAADAYRQALGADPKAAAALFNLARIETDAGNAAQARALWNRYLELHPTGPWAQRAREALSALPEEGPR